MVQSISYDKGTMSGKAQKSTQSILAAMRAGGQTKRIAITDISLQGCSARTTLAVTRQQVVKLQLFEDKGNGKPSGFSPISASIESASKKRIKDTDIYEIKVKFNSAVNASHGIAQVLTQREEIDDSDEEGESYQESTNKSLFDIPVRCYLCGEEHIPFRSLQSRSMAGHANVFGVAQYKEPLPGQEFCDYNLVRITVCPSCYFASGYVGDFEREKKTIKNAERPFEIEPIIEQWRKDAPQRKALLKGKLKGFYSENRKLEQALLSYDLAVISCDALMQAEMEKKERLRNFEIARKAVFYMMIKAELLMNNKKPKAAEDIIKQARSRLEKIFPNLKRDSSIKAASLLGMLGLYFEDHKLVSQNLEFLRQYDKNNNVRFGTDEQKSLNVSLKKMNDAYQNRAEFSKKNLKGFNPPY